MNYEKPSAQNIREEKPLRNLRVIYFHSDISRFETSDQLESVCDCSNIVAELIEKIVKTGIISGRPSTLLAINADYN